MPILDNVPAKLKIQAYTDPEFSSKAGDAIFEVMYNPESYSVKYEQEFEEEKAKGNSSAAPVYAGTKPQELSIEFTLDGTGVSGKAVDVQTEVLNFKSICVDYHGDEHRPFFLHVSWGTLALWGILKSADVKYTLFDKDGNPLRAKVTASFVETETPEAREAREKNSSPDLTHLRQVKAGDTLPLMTYKIYGNSKHYLEVARVNGLDDYRNLVPGTQIYFPPISKTD